MKKKLLSICSALVLGLSSGLASPNLQEGADGLAPQRQTTAVVISDLSTYVEPFDGTAAPTGWEIIDHLGNGQVWKFGKPYTSPYIVNVGDNNCAYLSSSFYGAGKSQNSSLISPTFDLTDYKDITLTFSNYYKGTNSSTGTVSYSTDNGLNWIDIIQWKVYNSTGTFSQPLPELNYLSNVRFKFTYTGNNSYFWIIDNFDISGTYIPIKPEPKNHATYFSVSNVKSMEMTLTWKDAVDMLPPDGYLILANTTGNFEDPIDGVPVADDLDMSDGNGSVNVKAGIQKFTFVGLKSPSVKYYFKIFVYNNARARIDYKKPTVYPYPPVTYGTTENNTCEIDLSKTSYSQSIDGANIPNIPSCTIKEDTNSDNSQWESSSLKPRVSSYYTKHLALINRDGVAMNDWFFTAPLLMRAGYNYEISFWYASKSSINLENLEVKWGNVPRSDHMTYGQLFVNEGFKNTQYVQVKTVITAEQNGIYYIGWHGFSNGASAGVYLDDIVVTELGPSNHAPVVSLAIPDVFEKAGFGSKEIELCNYFTDPDGDLLTYSAVSDNPGVAAVTVAGSMLMLTEKGIGSANITVTASDGKGGSVDQQFTCFVDQSTAVGNVEQLNMTVSPNPATDKITINLQDSDAGQATIELFNIHGQQVHKSVLGMLKTQSPHIIDVSAHARGIYLMVYSNGKVRKVQKLILK